MARPGTRIGIYPLGPTVITNSGGGSWRAVYQLAPQLQDSAEEYAYMSLALAPQAPCGRGVFAGSMRPGAFSGTPMVAQNTAETFGVPTTAGQIVNSPLYGRPNG